MRKTTFWGIFFLIFSISSADFLFFGQDETVKPVLKVGTISTPNGGILRFIKDNFKNEEFELEIIEYSNYIQPNLDLLEGVIDCNYSQNDDFLNSYNIENHTNIISYGKAYFEKMGIYSKRYRSINDFKNIVIAIPNIESDRIRALKLLEQTGLIKLNNEYQVVENPRNISFLEISPKYLVRVMEQADAIIANGNVILQRECNPSKDALYLEEYDAKYINVLAGMDKSRKKVQIQRLNQLLNSSETLNFIRKEYKGIVIKKN